MLDALSAQLASLEGLLAVPFLVVLAAGMYTTWISRGVQFRGLVAMTQLLVRNPSSGPAGAAQIDARGALFTAMSTTIGIGNIVGPVLAIGYGGPGALFCYVLASVFGASLTFCEVQLALKYRRPTADGGMAGGPMPYVADALSPGAAKAYAVFCCLVLLAWSTNQSNALAAILEPRGVAPAFTGIVLAAAVLAIVVGGIGRIGQINDRMVPIMFVLYSGACLYVIGCHAGQLGSALSEMVGSFFTPRSLSGGVGTAVALQMLRWGMARAVHSNEAGVGTSTIAHSLSSGTTPTQQGLLAIVAVYSNGLLCMLTGLAVLTSGVARAPGAVFDINLMVDLFAAHIPQGALPLSVSAFLFAFGTVLGNVFNGSQCFLHLAPRRALLMYQGAGSVALLIGTVTDLRVVWTLGDWALVPVVLINVAAVCRLTRCGKVDFNLHANAEP